MASKWIVPRNAGIALTSTAVILPIAYFIYFSRAVRSSTKSLAGIRRIKGIENETSNASNTPDSMPWKPVSLPEDVRSDASDWVLAYERVVSHPIPAASLALSPAESGGSSPSPLMRTYASGTHLAFSSTPQALLIRSVVDAATRRTFDANWIKGIAFENGDVVNGVYKVSYHGAGQEPSSERIELIIDAPASYKGAVPRGIILAEVERSGEDHVTFVNETWMWRKQTEKPTLIESSFGAWMHTLMAGWLVKKGISAVVAV